MGSTQTFGVLLQNFLISDQLSGTKLKMTSRQFFLYVLIYSLKVRSGGIVAFVPATRLMDMVQVLSSSGSVLI